MNREKKWVTLAECSLQVYKWVPVADSEVQIVQSKFQRLFCCVYLTCGFNVATFPACVVGSDCTNTLSLLLKSQTRKGKYDNEI